MHHDRLCHTTPSLMEKLRDSTLTRMIGKLNSEDVDWDKKANWPDHLPELIQAYNGTAWLCTMVRKLIVCTSTLLHSSSDLLLQWRKLIIRTILELRDKHDFKTGTLVQWCWDQEMWSHSEQMLLFDKMGMSPHMLSRIRMVRLKPSIAIISSFSSPDAVPLEPTVQSA